VFQQNTAHLLREAGVPISWYVLVFAGMDLLSKQARAIHDSVQQSRCTVETKLLQFIGYVLLGNNNSLTFIANDLRLLVLMRNQNSLKTDLNKNYKSPSAN